MKIVLKNSSLMFKTITAPERFFVEDDVNTLFKELYISPYSTESRLDASKIKSISLYYVFPYQSAYITGVDVVFDNSGSDYAYSAWNIFDTAEEASNVENVVLGQNPESGSDIRYVLNQAALLSSYSGLKTIFTATPYYAGLRTKLLWANPLVDATIG